VNSDKKITPFQFRHIKCPMCEFVSIFKTLKPSSFIEKEFAIDTKSTVSTITVKGYEGLIPRHYRIGKCGECSWASDLNDPVAGTNITTKALKAAISAARESAPDKDVLAVLNRGIGTNDAVPYSLIEVLKLHLLACKNLTVIPELQERDPYHLARFALRTAWVLEDIRDAQNEATDKAKELFTKIEPGWKGLPTSSTGFREWAVVLYERSLTASRLIETTKDEVDVLLLLARLDLSRGDLLSAKKRSKLAKSRVDEYEGKVKTDYNKLLKVSEDQASKVRAAGMADIRKMGIARDDVERLIKSQSDALAKKEMDKALKLINGIDLSHDKTITRILSEAGISTATISDIVARGKKEKKGVFSWLSK